ncbi:Major Facilitator Superfamily protein [Teratosphaeria destructans]|uniref:Major Facilitator Superfamily protein n=1 Tax=Teratosphaeria destructans TaxID=418781 RepID=A0A9W7T145_9PEZI|nr:Major Facilitator Superfamily protein [Teratosphaeria destructans]
MSGDHPDVFNTATRFTSDDPYASTLNISRGMRYALLQLDRLVPEEYRDDGIKSFLAYIHDPKNKFSHCDGGQLMYNFRFDGKAVLFNAHMGAYEGIMRSLRPKPDIAILGAAGQPNHDGRPFEGSPAEFARLECEWLEHPGKVIWCLHDESPIRPYRVDTTAATTAVNEQTKSKVWDLKPATVYQLFD